MILYFSATGNTEFIAQEIAKRLDDECVNLLDRIKNDDHTPLHSKKPYVICAPVYVCEMPRFLAKYLKEQEFEGSKDVYFIFTSGGYCGISSPLAKKIFRKKKMNYHGRAEVKMPRNYVANDAYPMLPKEEVESRIKNAYARLDEIANNIKLGNKLKARYVFLFEKIITLPFNPIWCKYKLKAKDFFVKDSCVGCGKCVKLCPLNNIKMIDNKPSWGDKCTHCMACIGNCPLKAIEYGEITKDKDPYNFGKYRYVVKELEKNKK